jgi:hypothetical protein
MASAFVTKSCWPLGDSKGHNFRRFKQVLSPCLFLCPELCQKKSSIQLGAAMFLERLHGSDCNGDISRNCKQITSSHPCALQPYLLLLIRKVTPFYFQVWILLHSFWKMVGLLVSTMAPPKKCVGIQKIAELKIYDWYLFSSRYLILNVSI